VTSPLDASLSLGPALHPSGEARDGQLVERLARGGAHDVLAVVDEARVGLGDDDVVVFLLSYEACCGLDPRQAPLRSDERVPAAIAWRARTWPVAHPAKGVPAAPKLALSTTTAARAAHLQRLAVCRERLLDGVIYQANLAHRLRVARTPLSEARAFFEARRASASCAAWLVVDGHALVSLSPERFVEAELAAGVARTYPIKGTTRRGSDATDDEARVAWLRASEKDRAEHVMIVDLLRNDLGKIAVAGGVTVESLMHVIETPSVWHLESRVSARLLPDVGVHSVIAATAPGGSITGAPKSAAIDVIAALEAGPRGLYTGVLGTVDGHGRLRTSLLIRTWWCPSDGDGDLHVGGGIVVDSDGEAEWQETLRKAEAFGAVSVDDAVT